MSSIAPADMTPQRWRRIEALFEAALDLDAGGRQALLDESCGEDDELRAAVETLLAADENPPELFEQSAASFAAPAWTEAPPPALDGAELGDYRLISEIGRGGMSLVFLAERTDDRLDRRVAVKILRSTLWHRDELERRFHAEGLVQASLSHPNIAQVFDAGVDAQGNPFLIMEYVDGDAITEHCSAAGLAVDDRLALFLDVCQAVQHAHRRLIVHRDLKPSNILVDRSGRVKLLDFGIAKLLDPAEHPIAVAGQALTRTGFLPMTPEYSAPEQVRGGEITTATDVYALGLLLFELLTGSRLRRLDRLTPSEIERVVCIDEPPKPSLAATGKSERKTHGLAKELRGDLDTIVLKTLRKEPEERYGSVEALANDVQRYREGLPIEARPTSVAYRTARFVRRHRLGVSAAVLALLALIAFGATMAWQQTQTALERDRTQVERDRAENLLEFLLGLFAASDPREALGEDTTARQLLERGVQQISEMDDQPHAQARMLDVLGTVYGNLGNLDRASSLLRQAIAVERSDSDQETIALADVQDHLAAVLQQQSEYQAAESLWRSAVDIRRGLLGAQHLDVATGLNNLAVALKEQGKETEAETLLREALAIRRTALGNDHPDVAESLVNLGGLLHAMGRYEEAEPLLRESMKVARSTYPPAHPRIADVDNSLANLLTRLGRYDEAEPLLREALDLRRQAYGAEHHLVAKNLNDLAVLLEKRGDFEAAAHFYRQALASYEQLGGPDHLAVAIVGNNLSGSLILSGEYKLAEEGFRRSLEITQRVLEPGNRYAVISLTGIGIARHGARDYAAAERHYREALTMARGIFDTDHPNLASPLLELGRLLVETGRATEAEAYLRQAHQIYFDTYGADHTSSARAAMWQAMCEAALGEREVAVRLLTAAREVQSRVLPSSHPHLLETERALERTRSK